MSETSGLSLVAKDAPVLHSPARPISDEDWTTLPSLISEMYAVMTANKGCGLAAPQVGVDLRVFVLDIRGLKRVCVNPAIVRANKRMTVEWEGCLSYPNEHVPVKRPASITVEYTDENRKVVQKSMSGWEARAFQHELDHLDGIVFHDKAEKLI